VDAIPVVDEVDPLGDAAALCTRCLVLEPAFAVFGAVAAAGDAAGEAAGEASGDAAGDAVASLVLGGAGAAAETGAASDGGDDCAPATLDCGVAFDWIGSVITAMREIPATASQQRFMDM
jgi:hypothetical protein